MFDTIDFTNADTDNDNVATNSHGCRACCCFRVEDALKALTAYARPGSSNRICRALPVDEMPGLNPDGITDEVHLDQRAVLTPRALLMKG